MLAELAQDKVYNSPTFSAVRGAEAKKPELQAQYKAVLPASTNFIVWCFQLVTNAVNGTKIGRSL